MTRRELLHRVGAGFGMVGLANVLSGAEGQSPLAVKQPHFPAKAKRVIFLFLNGGMSQVDTFDPKPMLIKHDGEPMPGPKIKTDRGTENQNLPGFIVLCPGYPVLGAQLWDSAFLPSVYQGTYIASGEKEPGKLLRNIRNNSLSLTDQERELALVSKLNRSYVDRL